MNCSSCSKQITPVAIGTGNYCPSCGARIESEADVAATPKPKMRSMDIRSGRHAQPVASTRQQTPVVDSSSKKTSVGDVIPAPKTNAQAVHERVKLSRGGAIDLRSAQPMPAKIAPETKPAAPSIVHHATPHISKPSASQIAPIPAERLEKAKSIPKSGTISRFIQSQLTPPVAETQAKVAPVIAPKATSVETPSLPPRAITQHESLMKVVASTPAEPIKGLQTSRMGQLAATFAAISILAGYVWVVNYPKLAITSAGNKAGVSATLPSYLPSSYSLAATTTAPGIVTLQFASPNQSNPLTITQHRTAWDSNSLVDNYLSKVTSEYSSIEGQGLTVYLFDKNNASWVNRGVWYSIAGTAKLSREQILKIAYSL